MKKGRAAGEELRRPGLPDDEAKKVLFGQTAASVASAAKGAEKKG